MLALSPQFLSAHRETKNAKRAFQEYTNSIANQHFKEAYAQCGREFQDALSYNDFVNSYESLENQYGNLKAITAVSYEVHGRGKPLAWTAIINADLIYERRTLRFEFALQKENGLWVIFGTQQI